MSSSEKARNPESVPDLTEPERLDWDLFPPQTQLHHIRNINSNLMQEALNVWADIWTEFEGRVTHGTTVLPGARKGFIPECGWPEFLEKLWLLRFHIDSAKKFNASKS
jgi:hypothetical protein